MLQGYRQSVGLGICPSLVVRASRSGLLEREFLATLITVVSPLAWIILRQGSLKDVHFSSSTLDALGFCLGHFLDVAIH